MGRETFHILYLTYLESRWIILLFSKLPQCLFRCESIGTAVQRSVEALYM